MTNGSIRHDSPRTSPTAMRRLVMGGTIGIDLGCEMISKPLARRRLLAHVDFGLDRLEAGDERRTGGQEAMLGAAGRDVEDTPGGDRQPAPRRRRTSARHR